MGNADGGLRFNENIEATLKINWAEFRGL